MIDFKWLSEPGATNALFGVFGGASRLASGFAPFSSWGRELAMFFFASAPIAWLSGGLAEEYGFSGYLVSAAAFGSGLLAHNIIKFMLSLEIAGIINLIRGIK